MSQLPHKKLAGKTGKKNAKKEKKEGWFLSKSYVHFTPHISGAQFEKLKAYVSNSGKVAKHAFYPLIYRSVIQRRYKKLKDNKGNASTHPKTKQPRGHYNHDKGESNAKLRKIYYATHWDAHIYAYYAYRLADKYEQKLEDLNDCITAYRKISENPDIENSRGKCNIDFAHEVFEYVRKQETCTVLAFDISAFFDSLDHTHLKQAWADVLNKDKLPPDHYNIFKSLTNFSYVAEKELLRELDLLKIKNKKEQQTILKEQWETFLCTKEEFETAKKPYQLNTQRFRQKIVGKDNCQKRQMVRSHPFKDKETKQKKGIPQGTPISATLANIYLLEFDHAIFNWAKANGGFYRRYSDDIILVCPSKQATEGKNLVWEEIRKYKVVINRDKTEEFHFGRSDGELKISSNSTAPVLQYLGFEFDGKTTRIKNAGMATYYRNMKRLVRRKALQAHRLQQGKKTIHANLHRQLIHKRYSHRGNKNYLNYTKKAAKIMNEKAILSQTKGHWKKLNDYIRMYEEKYNLPRR